MMKAREDEGFEPPRYSVAPKVGTVVWVKMEGWPWWPAKVVDREKALEQIAESVADEFPPANESNAMVRFFNYRDPYEVVETKQLVEFVENIFLLRKCQDCPGEVLLAAEKALEWIDQKGIPEQNAGLDEPTFTIQFRLYNMKLEKMIAEQDAAERAKKCMKGRKERTTQKPKAAIDAEDDVDLLRAVSPAPLAEDAVSYYGSGPVEGHSAAGRGTRSRANPRIWVNQADTGDDSASNKGSTTMRENNTGCVEEEVLDEGTGIETGNGNGADAHQGARDSRIGGTVDSRGVPEGVDVVEEDLVQPLGGEELEESHTRDGNEMKAVAATRTVTNAGQVVEPNVAARDRRREPASQLRGRGKRPRRESADDVRISVIPQRREAASTAGGSRKRPRTEIEEDKWSEEELSSLEEEIDKLQRTASEGMKRLRDQMRSLLARRAARRRRRH